MKITFLLPGAPLHPVGGVRVVFEYANHLAARGHDVSVVFPRYRNRVPGTVKAAFGNWVERLRTAVAPRSVAWHPLDRRVRMHYVPTLHPCYIPDGDIVVATAWWTARYAQVLPPAKGARFYLIQAFEVWDGSEEEVSATWRYPMRKIVVGRWLLEKALEMGIPAREVRHITNAIDHTRFRLLQPIENRPARVAMLYHPHTWKGAAEGIQALEMARSAIPGLRAVLFGVERRPADLPSWFEYCRNPDQAELVEYVYNRSSTFLCSSWTEGWGLPGAEAMACGCALVSTDNGGVRDYADHGENALLVPPRDPPALAAQLIRVLRDEPLRLAIARRGTERIRQFTWERATDALEDWFAEAAGRGASWPR